MKKTNNFEPLSISKIAILRFQKVIPN